MTIFTKIILGAVVTGAVIWLWPKPAWASPKRVLVVGDSLVGSSGFLSTLEEGFEPGVTVNLVSLPGKGAAAIKDAGLEAARLLHPDVVVILAGVNDLASGRGWQHAAAQLDEFYFTLKQMGVYVVAVQLTPWDTHVEGRHLQGETKTLNTWIARHNVPVATVYTDRIEGQGKDGLHLSAQGSRQLAEAVLYAFGK